MTTSVLPASARRAVQGRSGPACYTCRAMPAKGMSAFCTACQPVSATYQPTGNESVCGACDWCFSSLSGFDRHRPGACLDPASVGLVPVERHGTVVWRFPAPETSPWNGSRSTTERESAALAAAG
jgi:hypothetical protein